MFHALFRIWKEEGLKALYSGIAPAILRQASYGTIKIGTYQSFKRLFVDKPEVIQYIRQNVPPDIKSEPDMAVQYVTKRMEKAGAISGHGNHSVSDSSLIDSDHLDRHGNGGWNDKGNGYLSNVKSSFVCGLAGALTSNPIDVVRTRMMNQKAINDGTTFVYKGTMDCFVQILGLPHTPFQRPHETMLSQSVYGLHRKSHERDMNHCRALPPAWRSSHHIPQIPAAFSPLSCFTTCAISVRLGGSQLIRGSASRAVDPENVLAGGSALNNSKVANPVDHNCSILRKDRSISCPDCDSPRNRFRCTVRNALIPL
ncbi:KMCP1 protein, partial [Polypterus senegalus]